ncbi:MAG: hypothetical protein ACK55Z_24840, partial [bacterium]
QRLGFLPGVRGYAGERDKDKIQPRKGVVLDPGGPESRGSGDKANGSPQGHGTGNTVPGRPSMDERSGGGLAREEEVLNAAGRGV